jgi:uncharacterized protein (TIGR04222 family)
MSSGHAQLLDSILTFNLDHGDCPLPFAARLAREHGWSRAYAERVIVEYKRFVFLAAIRAKPVCPSEDVDAAWHLHLTHTRSYWTRLCGEILGRPLHHDPTRGGPAEGEKHLAMYAETLEAYRVAFDAEPPPDIWPPARLRFGDDLKHRSVNTARNWVIPKAPVKTAARLAMILALVALALPGCAGGLNPFALRGVDFLYFLIPMMLGAALVGRVIRSHLAGPSPRPEDDTRELSWAEAAYVGGGSARLTTATIAHLAAEGSVAVEGTRLVRRESGSESERTPVETAVLNALPFTNDGTSIRPVVQAIEAAYQDESRQLEADGLLLGEDRHVVVSCLAAVPLLVVLLIFALPRLWLFPGFRGPSALFFVGLFLLIIGVLITHLGFSRMTPRGRHVLERMSDRRQGLRTATLWESRGDAALAVALFGTVALAGSPLMILHDWYPRQTTADGGGCGSGCGTGGCSSGGDGGGCGGGGCGGGD